MADYTLLIGGTDYTAALLANTMTLRANSFDFSLINPLSLGGGIGITAAVSFSWPGMNVAWQGTITWWETRASSERGTDEIHICTATNTTVPPAVTGPFDLDSTPTDNATLFELEDGSGHLLLEDGTPTGPGSYLTEGTHSYGYSRMSSSIRQNPDHTLTIIQTCTVFKVGLWTGQSIRIRFAIGADVITDAIRTLQRVTVTWPTKNEPVYQIEAGDPLVNQSLAGVA